MSEISLVYVLKAQEEVDALKAKQARYDCILTEILETFNLCFQDVKTEGGLHLWGLVGHLLGEFKEKPRMIGNLKKRVCQFECGEIKDSKEMLKLFADLINTGYAWTSSDMIKQIAQGCIDSGSITHGGTIIEKEET